MTKRASSAVCIGKRIRAFRIAAGYTNQDEFARRLKTNPSQVSRWENGAKAPSLGSLAKIAQVLGVSLDDIAGNVAGESGAAA